MAGVNRIVRSINPKSVIEDARSSIDSTVSFNQGDLLVFDDTANLLKVPTAEADGSTFLGIASESVVSGRLARPYSTDVDASASTKSAIPGPVCGVIAKLVLKTGAALNNGDNVYLDPASGTYHVQEAGTKAIGKYFGPNISSAAAGQYIEVTLGHRHPGDVLVMP